MSDHRAAISGAGTRGPASLSTKSRVTWWTITERKEEKEREASKLPKEKRQVLKSAKFKCVLPSRGEPGMDVASEGENV